MDTDTDRKLKVAVVGLGKMGLLHASLLSVLQNVQLAAVCDKSWLLRKMAKHTLKEILVADDLTHLSGLDLDAIYVTTPIPSHYSIIREIYSNNIARNVFVEKTLSSTPAKSQELSNVSMEKKGVTMVGYMERFCVTFRKAKELLSQEILGKVHSFEAYALSSDFAEAKKGSSIAGARGGALEDLGSHVADLALWFFADLHVTSAKIESTIAPGSVDSASFKVNSLNGVEGAFNISWVKPGYRMPEFGLNIRGANGTLTVTDSMLRLSLNDAKPVEWYRQDLDDNVYFMLGEPEYFREDEHFVSSIIRGGNSESNFESAARVDSLLHEVRCRADE